MAFKIMVTLTVIFFTIVCLTRKTAGKPFDTDTLDDLKGKSEHSKFKEANVRS